MELTLKRSYAKGGTNGTLYAQVCHTIELPWQQNKRNVSCIPEGRYELRKRYTAKRGEHLVVMNVPARSGILFHPANNAPTELLGCIAPVTKHTGNGKGTASRIANNKLKKLVFEALNKDEKVFITISS